MGIKGSGDALVLVGTQGSHAPDGGLQGLVVNVSSQLLDGDLFVALSNLHSLVHFFTHVSVDFLVQWRQEVIKSIDRRLFSGARETGNQ